MMPMDITEECAHVGLMAPPGKCLPLTRLCRYPPSSPVGLADIQVGLMQNVHDEFTYKDELKAKASDQVEESWSVSSWLSTQTPSSESATGMMPFFIRPPFGVPFLANSCEGDRCEAKKGGQSSPRAPRPPPAQHLSQQMPTAPLTPNTLANKSAVSRWQDSVTFSSSDAAPRATSIHNRKTDKVVGNCGDPSLLVWRENVWYCLVCNRLADDCHQQRFPRRQAAELGRGPPLQHRRVGRQKSSGAQTPGWEPWGEAWEMRLKEQCIQEQGAARGGAAFDIQWV